MLRIRRIRIRGIRMFLGLPDLHPDPLVTTTDPDPSTSSKKVGKTLIFYCFVTSLRLVVFEEWCKCTDVPDPDPYVLGPPGSASVSPRYGSEDPDPDPPKCHGSATMLKNQTQKLIRLCTYSIPHTSLSLLFRFLADLGSTSPLFLLLLYWYRGGTLLLLRFSVLLPVVL